jgi:chain length determinant protein EpsF
VRDWLADNLLTDLEVIPARESSVITISYANQDPRFAAQMANAFADAYVQTNLELRIDPAKRQAAWFQDQVIQLRQTLEAAQQKLSAYQQSKGLVGSENRLDLESTRLTELNSQLVAAQSARADAESRLKQLNEATATGTLDQLPDIINNGLMQSMKADLARAEGKLAESAERYGTGHPTYIASLAEVNSLRARLKVEMATATGSIQQAAQIAAQRVDELQAQVDNQKARIMTLRSGNDAQSVLLQDVDSAQRAYDSAQLRASQVRLQSQLDQTTVAVLNPAIAPTRAERPKVTQNVLLAFVLGLLVSVAAALLVELTDRRVRSEADITDLAGMPLLAQVPYVIR